MPIFKRLRDQAMIRRLPLIYLFTIYLFTVYLFTLLSFVASARVAASEIDSFTTRNIALPDASLAINAVINERLEQGVRNANLIDQANASDEANYAPCNEQTLYRELRKAIFDSFTASWGLKGYALDLQLREKLRAYSYQLLLNDSVYRDLNYLEAFSLNLKELSDVVRIDGHLIGIDKFGHFFAEGWQYFEISAGQEQTIVQAMAWGREQEQGKFGYSTTGIFSYADLTANFNGWRFWNHLLGKQKDPLRSTLENWFSRDYVSCSLQIQDSFRQGRRVYAWQYKGNFDVGDYVDGAWDEGQNCNSFADPVIEHKIEKRLQRLEGKGTCPWQPSVCQQAQSRYGRFSKWLLHPRCLSLSAS
jgi:hypothetical protein